MSKGEGFVNIGQLVVGAKVLACAVGGMIAGWDMSIKALLLFTAIDYVTGTLNALFIHKKWTSEVGGKGIAKKTQMMLLVAACHAVDRFALFPVGPINLGFGEINGLGAAVSLWFCLNEFGSVVENVRAAGIAIPAPVTTIMERLKGVKPQP